MDAINNFWSGVLQFLTPIVTPDWGALVGLLPLLLLVPVVLYILVTVRAWRRMHAQLPASLRRRPNRRAQLALHAGGVLLGGVTVALAFAVAGTPEDRTIGLTVSIPLLVLGVLIAVGTVGNGIVAWENGTVDEETGEVDPSAAWVAAHRRPITLIIQFLLGVAIAAVGLLLLPPADSTGVQPVATVPILVVGLLLSISAVGRAIMGFWNDDDATDLVPVEAPGGASRTG
jgi:hypothetical protein